VKTIARMVLHLILKDDKTNDVWKTPEHNDNYKKDDFHDKVKRVIIADLPKKLKDLFGRNCNIEIREGEIYIVSQIFDSKTGNRSNKRIRTELKAENYFEKVAKFILLTILHELELSDYRSIVITINENAVVEYIVEIENRKKETAN
jgi:hypothetical protein